MASLPITAEQIERVDRFMARFHSARMGALAALRGNPFGVEILHFGDAVGIACKIRHPLLRGKNRIHGFGPNDIPILDDLLQFYRADGLCCSLSVPYGSMTEELFRRLGQGGMWSAGSGAVPAIIPLGPADDSAPPTPVSVTVRPSGLSEKELYLDLFQQAFSDRDERDPEYRAVQWAEDALPGGARYIAEWNGIPAGMGSLPILEGVGFFGTGGVLPEYRGWGIQMAMIRRRIADAPAQGCDLLLGGGSLGTTAYRNFERAGLRLIPTGMAWRDRPAQR